jgi:hypothetical protein
LPLLQIIKIILKQKHIQLEKKQKCGQINSNRLENIQINSASIVTRLPC